MAFSEDELKRRYTRELRNLIYNAILQSSGQETTFVYVAYKQTSRFVKCILHNIMCDQGHIDGDIKVFEKILSSYGDAITYTSQKEIVKDERQLLKRGQVKHAQLIIRRIYRIGISQRYAEQIYNDVFGAGENAFKNKLLHEHTHILEEIVNRYKLGEAHKSNLVYREYSALQTFDVELSGIERTFTTYGDESFTSSIGYHEFGMKNLSNITQCYGMALAIVDVLKRTIWVDKTVDIKITYYCWAPNKYNRNCEYIQVSYDFGRKTETGTPVLKDW